MYSIYILRNNLKIECTSFYKINEGDFIYEDGIMVGFLSKKLMQYLAIELVGYTLEKYVVELDEKIKNYFLLLKRFYDGDEAISRDQIIDCKAHIWDSYIGSDFYDYKNDYVKCICFCFSFIMFDKIGSFRKIIFFSIKSAEQFYNKQFVIENTIVQDETSRQILFFLNTLKSSKFLFL
jgi:hypothetical protein